MLADCLKLIYLDISGFKRNDSPSSNYRDYFNDKIPSKGTIILSSSINKKIEKFIPKGWNVTKV